MLRVGEVFVNEGGRIVPHVSIRTEGRVLVRADCLEEVLTKISEWGEAAARMGAEAQAGTPVGELAMMTAEGEA